MLTVYSTKHMGWEGPNISLDCYELFCDDASDLPDNPYFFSKGESKYKIAQGSLAYIVNTADVYIYNSQGEWKQGNVAPDYTEEIEDMLSGNITSISIPANTTSLRAYALSDCATLKSITFEGTPSGTIAATAFNNDTAVENIYVPWDNGDKADAPWGAVNALIWYNNKTYVTIPTTATDVDNTLIGEVDTLTTIEFLGTPTSISADAFSANDANVTEIICPWNDGDVANAPWGASNATITYTGP